MCTCCRHARGRFACTHGGVLSLHTGFSACHTTHTTHHTTTNTSTQQHNTTTTQQHTTTHNNTQQHNNDTTTHNDNTTTTQQNNNNTQRHTTTHNDTQRHTTTHNNTHTNTHRHPEGCGFEGWVPKCGPGRLRLRRVCAAHLHGVPQVQLLNKVVVPVVCTTNALIQVRSTVEVPQLQFPLQGRHHPRRCAETGSHGLTVQQTTEILLLQYIDKVFDDLVVHSSRFLGCSRGEDGLDPTVAPRSRVQTWRKRSRSHSCNVHAGHCCSHASRYATTGAGDGRDSAVNCGGALQLALIGWLDFLGPCAQVHGQG